MNRLASTNSKRIFPLEKITLSLRVSLKPDRELAHIEEAALVLPFLGHLMPNTWKLMYRAARNHASAVLLRAFKQRIDGRLDPGPFVPPRLASSMSIRLRCVERDALIAPPVVLLRPLLHAPLLPLASSHEEPRYLVLHAHSRANSHRTATAFHLETELCPSVTRIASTRHHRLMIAPRDVSENRAADQRVPEVVGTKNVVDARAEVVDPTLQLGVETGVRIAF